MIGLCCYCASTSETPVCHTCSERLVRFVTLTNKLTQFNPPPVRIPRLRALPGPRKAKPIPRKPYTKTSPKWTQHLNKNSES